MSYHAQPTLVSLPLQGGVDDFDSLCLENFSPAETTQNHGWFPNLKPGRYLLDGAKDFQYRFARAQTANLNLPSGLSHSSVVFPFTLFSSDTLAKAPLVLQDANGVQLTQVQNTVRWALPVPETNTILAGGFIDPRFLSSTSDPLGISGPSSSDLIWFYPTWGADVLCIHRSRNPRSYDVLADEDALLYEVATPNLLQDDRSYCYDPLSGLAYGRVASESLPPQPYGPGTVATTYVSLAFPGDSDPALLGAGLANTQSTYWQNYFSTNAGFFESFEGSSAESFYNPLRLEEITKVDRDGLVRLRRTDVVSPTDFGGDYAPSLFFAAPEGFVSLTTQSVTGNIVEATLADPSLGGSQALLEYGTTVVARYYARNTFTIGALTGGATVGSGSVTGSIHLLTKGLTPTGTLTFESDPRGLTQSLLDTNAPNLNPLVSQVKSGFLYLQSNVHPPTIPSSKAGVLNISVARPLRISSVGEEFTITAALLDSAGIPISEAPQALTFTPSRGITVLHKTPSTGIAASSGEVIYRLRMDSDSPVTIALSDTRNSGVVLDSRVLDPVVISGTNSFPLNISDTHIPQPWEPSVLVSLGESYQTKSGQERRVVRVLTTTPEGFPWHPYQEVAGNPSLVSRPVLTLTSQKSTFHDSSAGSFDVPLGSKIQILFDGSSSLISSDGLLSIGYSPLVGDVLQAAFYLGDDCWSSFPIKVT